MITYVHLCRISLHAAHRFDRKVVIGAKGIKEVSDSVEALAKIYRYMEQRLPANIMRKYEISKPELEGLRVIEAKSRYLHRSTQKCWVDAEIEREVR